MVPSLSVSANHLPHLKRSESATPDYFLMLVKVQLEVSRDLLCYYNVTPVLPALCYYYNVTTMKLLLTEVKGEDREFDHQQSYQHHINNKV